MNITIYHNPRCSNSRNALAMIREKGFEPTVVEYLTATPGVEELAALIERAGISARELIRTKEAPYAELGLDDPARNDSDLLAAMVAHPVLINRPLVVTPLGVRLCRPPELVLEILPS